jgi:flap endonuclease-1
MRAANITPIVIFDGKPPTTKTEVLDQRRDQRETAQKEIGALEHTLDVSANMSQMEKALTEKRISTLKSHNPTVSSSDRDLVKQLLYGAGVLFVAASGEADDLLGFLARSNMVHAIVSTDMDMLVRGVPFLIIPETPDTTVLTEIMTDTILCHLGLTYPGFVDACILMGTDYTTFRTKPPAEAIACVKRGNPFAGLDPAVITGAKAALLGSNSLETLLNPVQLEKFQGGAPPREPETLARMAVEYGWPVNWGL